MTKTMAKKRDEGLCARVDAQPLLTEGGRLVLLQHAPRGEFGQKRFGDEQSEAGVAAGNRMADSVALRGVEKKNLVGLGDGLIARKMADVDAAVRKNHLRCGRRFFEALLAACAAAFGIPNGDRGGFQESLNVEFRHRFASVSRR